MTDLGGDTEATARTAIQYLMLHDPVVSVTFPANDSPFEDMLRLLAPHMVGMEGEIAHLVARYLCESIAPHLGLRWAVIDWGDGRAARACRPSPPSSSAFKSKGGGGSGKSFHRICQFRKSDKSGKECCGSAGSGTRLCRTAGPRSGKPST